MPAQRIAEFDVWRPGYGSAEVTVYIADTTNLAPIFLDEALTIAADNPQVLLDRDLDGQNYGKFTAPVYTAYPYRLVIDSTTEQTGIMRPGITSLEGEDASLTTVSVEGIGVSNTIESIVSREVYAENHGVIYTDGSHTLENTNTITTAIGVAGAQGGGEVLLPAGQISFSSITLPAGVVLKGKGKGVTVLQSIYGDASIIYNGEGSGLRKLTLDGVNLAPNSLGVSSTEQNNTVFDEVKIMRFGKSLVAKGGERNDWANLDVDNCNDAPLLQGMGDAYKYNIWRTGIVTNCTRTGVKLEYVDVDVTKNGLEQVGFDGNSCPAVVIHGARGTVLSQCWWNDNTINLTVEDDDAIVSAGTNKVQGLHLENCSMTGGVVNFTGNLGDVVLEKTYLDGVTFNMNTPVDNPVVLLDCFENEVTITGEGSKLIRRRTNESGASTGITSGNAATKAWSIALEPGQVVFLMGTVVGRQRNGVNRQAYLIAVGAYRPGSSLAYDTQTANFVVGEILTGASSGAIARITADSDGGATGTLTLQDIQGAFLDNEIITCSGGGSATVNGTLSNGAAALDTVGVTSLRTAYETNANTAATFVANGFEIELRVTGDTSQDHEWVADVKVVSVP